MKSSRGVDELDDETRTAAPPAATATPDLPGPLQERNRDRYEIIAEHGRGGLGRVFRAHDRDLRRTVAIKELLSRTDVAELRFYNEVLITAQLEHPGIVPVHEAGRWPDGTPFYAMKLVAGRPLSELMSRLTTPEARRDALRHITNVADAIAYAHSRQIIHRDLKPANVIVGDFGETIVVDWGLAKHLSAADAPTDDAAPAAPSPLTVAGAVLGTPAYMAPEQQRGEPVDERADVFAIGVMLRDLGLRDDADLDAIIDRATAPSPDARYPTARELAHDLHAYAAGRRITARDYSVLGVIGHWLRHHRAIAAVSAIALAAVTIAVVIAALRIIRARERAEDARDAAETALATSEESRKAAVLAQAEMLLEHDPTKAHSLLTTNSLLDAAPLLASRIRAAGIATHDIALDERTIYRLCALDTGHHVAAVTASRNLYVIDIDTGVHKKIDQLTIDRMFRCQGNSLIYVKKSSVGHAVVVTDLNGNQRTVAETQHSPRDTAYRNGVAYWRDADNNLWKREIDLHRGAVVIARQSAAFDVVGSTIYSCGMDGELRRIYEGNAIRLSRCNADVGILSLGSVAMTASTETELLVLDDDGVRNTLPIKSLEDRVMFADSGLVLSVGELGRGGLARREDRTFKPISLPPMPGRALAVKDSWIGLGFDDGSVLVRDVDNGDSWTIQAHDKPLQKLELLPGSHRIVTNGGAIIRVWELPEARVHQVGSHDGPALHMALGPDGQMLMDSRAGHAAVYSPTRGVVQLHSHDALSFGAGWCGKLACTAAWDRTVKCSNPKTLENEIVITADTRVRDLVSVGSDCLYQTEGGVIARVLARETVLEEPISAGRCGDAAGSVAAVLRRKEPFLIFDGNTGVSRFVETRGIDLAKCAWTRRGLASASPDGAITFWNRDFEPMHTVAFHARVINLKQSDVSVLAELAGSRIAVIDDDGRTLYDLQLPYEFSATAMSPSGRYVVVAADAIGELLVVDVPARQLTTLRIPTAYVMTMEFFSDSELLISATDNELFHIRLP
jgi:WD40 repeat protein